MGERERDKHVQVQGVTQEETKNLLQTAQVSKVVNPLTHALAPPFYRETKRLLHSDNTLELKEYS
jgi:hypothetical protein